MKRKKTLEGIDRLLSQQPQEKSEALLSWLEREDDAFEKQLRADIDAGILDHLIAEAIAEDDSGETIDLESPCN